MTEIILRTPCTFHTNCDETSVGILHRSSKEGQPRPDETMCMICEGVLEKARQTLKTTGKWKCPVCGVEHKVVDRKLVPPLSKWYKAFEIRRKMP